MKSLLLYLLLAVALTSGCQALYFVAPGSEDTKVEAKFADLKGKTLAIVILADPNTLLEYEAVQLELGDAVASELRKNVKDMNIVSSRRVVRYLDENPKAGSMPPEKLAGIFNADYVLIVTLLEYSTHEPGSNDLYRGHAVAEACLWPAKNTPANPQDPPKPAWQSETIKVTYPEELPQGVPVGDDRMIRIKTAHLFADEVAKNFYAHMVPDNKKPLDRS